MLGKAILFPLLVPLAARPERGRAPWATAGMIAACGLMYAAAVYAPEAMLANVAWHASGGYHQYLSYAFLHVNFAHLALNLYFLWVFGAAVEARAGAGRMLLFFLLSAATGALGHEFFGTQPQLAGASAGVFGLMGALAIVLPHERLRAWFCLLVLVVPVTMRTVLLRAWVFVPVYAALEMILRFMLVRFLDVPAAELPSTAAHLGGLVGGLAGALVIYGTRGLTEDQAVRRERRERWAAEPRPSEVEASLPAAGKTGKGDEPSYSARQANDPLLPVMRLVVQRRTEEARRAYLEVLEKDPEACLPAGAQMNFVRQLISVGEYDLAIHALEILLRHDPSEEVAASARFELAHLFLRLGQYPDRAAELLQRFLESRPPENLERQARALLEQLPAPRPAEQRRTTPFFETHATAEARAPEKKEERREPSVLDVLDDILELREAPPLQPEEVNAQYVKLSSSEIIHKADELFGDPEDSTGANVPIDKLMANAPAPQVKAVKPMETEAPIHFESSGGLSEKIEEPEPVEIDLASADSNAPIKIDDSGWVLARGLHAPVQKVEEIHPSMLVPPAAPRYEEEQGAPEESEGLWLPKKKREAELPSLKRADGEEETPKIDVRKFKLEPTPAANDELAGGDGEGMRKFRKEDDEPAGGRKERQWETAPAAELPEQGAQPVTTGPAYFITPSGVPLAPDETSPVAFQTAIDLEPKRGSLPAAKKEGRAARPSKYFSVVLSPAAKVDMPAVIFLMSRELGMATDPMHHALLRRRGILAEGLTKEAAREFAQKFAAQQQSVTIAPQDALIEFGEAVDVDRFMELRGGMRVGTPHGTEELAWGDVVLMAGGWVGLAPGTPCRAVIDLYFRQPGRHLRIWENTFIYPVGWRGDRSRKFQSLVQLLLGRTPGAMHTRTLNTWVTGEEEKELTTAFTSLIEYENFLRWHLLAFCMDGEKINVE